MPTDDPRESGYASAVSRQNGRNRLLELYYLLTPLFFLYDFFIGASIRIAAIPTPELRYLYYALIFGLGFLVRRRPRTGPWVGITESSANLLLLILSVMLPIWNAADAVLVGEAIGSPGLGTEELVNFLIVGPVLVISFKQNERALWRQASRRED